MVEVGYGTGRVGSELSAFVSLVLSEGRHFPKHDI